MMQIPAMSAPGEYIVRFVEREPSLSADNPDPIWHRADVLLIDNFHPRGSDHRPITQVRLLHSGNAIHLMFDVYDRYVRCVHTQYQAPVSKDSCVEWFVKPDGAGRYMNFEMNCGGNLLLGNNADPAITPPGTGENIAVDQTIASSLTIRSTLASVVNPEIIHPLRWRLLLNVPISVLESAFGTIGQLGATRWRGNFYKCGTETSHPHWASWAPLLPGDRPRFHQTESFGWISFENTPA
jgi:hypothetical protein